MLSMCVIIADDNNDNDNNGGSSVGNDDVHIILYNGDTFHIFIRCLCDNVNSKNTMEMVTEITIIINNNLIWCAKYKQQKRERERVKKRDSNERE